MRTDTKLNYFFLLFFLIAIVIGYNINKRISNDVILKITKSQKDLKAISEKIELYYQRYCMLPQSITEERFTEFLNGINTIDPFAPTHSRFIYIATNEKWKVYSIGPNKTDDGGVERSNSDSELLDIIIEGNFSSPRIDCGG